MLTMLGNIQIDWSRVNYINYEYSVPLDRISCWGPGGSPPNVIAIYFENTSDPLLIDRKFECCISTSFVESRNLNI